MENQYLSDIRFDSFGLDDRVLASLQEAGFEQCSRIQAETLPLALSGQDVTGQAQTGTGKTGAFLVAVFQRLLEQPIENPQPGSVRCLILAPTRELAIQIARDAEELGKHTGLRSILVYGGAAYEKQRRQFEQPVDLLIGTPGRVIDYWKQKVFSLKQAQAMVLDEADRMFDMGFISDVRYLLRKLPEPTERLNMLFSATLSQKVLELAYEHMNNPVPIKIEAESVSADNIVEHMYFPANQEKIPLLVGLIRTLEPFRAITFVNTKHNAENIDAYLQANGIKSALISGDVRQNKRERLLQEFSEGKHQVLIATDVAARGLHISDVTHVFNFDLPQIAEDYVHRIGRTARAGASGEAHSFACEDTAFYLPDIEEYTGKSIAVTPIAAEMLPELEKPKRIERNRPSGGRNSRGGSGNSSGRGGRGKPNSGGGGSQGNRSQNNNRRRSKPAAAQQSPQNSNSGSDAQPEQTLTVAATAGGGAVQNGNTNNTNTDAPKKKRRRRNRKPKAPGTAPTQ